MALALSVKLSVKATTNRRKFWRFNPNSLYFSKQFANFLLSESMQQTVSICVNLWLQLVFALGVKQFAGAVVIRFRHEDLGGTA
jgi:small basic protein